MPYSKSPEHHALHPEDLMKPDRLSGILLAASGVVLFVPLLLILAAAVAMR